MTAIPYSGLRVLEIGSRIAVGACGRLLADLGAAVDVLAMPGDVEAGRGKWRDRATATAGKRLYACDPAAWSDRARLASLAGCFDVVLTSSDADPVPSPTILSEAFAARVVVCDITAFRSSGPLAGRFAEEVALQAMTGVPETTGPAGARRVTGARDVGRVVRDPRDCAARRKVSGEPRRRRHQDRAARRGEPAGLGADARRYQQLLCGERRRESVDDAGSARSARCGATARVAGERRLAGREHGAGRFRTTRIRRQATAGTECPARPFEEVLTVAQACTYPQTIARGLIERRADDAGRMWEVFTSPMRLSPTPASIDSLIGPLSLRDLAWKDGGAGSADPVRASND